MVVHLNWQLVINPSHGNKDLISYQIFFYSRSRRPSAHHCIHNPQHLLTDLPFTTSRQLPYLPLLNLPLTVALRHTDLLLLNLLLLNLLLLNLLLLNLLLTGSAFTTFLLLLNLLMAALKLTGTTLPGLPVSVSLLPSAPLQELRSGHLRELRSGHLRELRSGHLRELQSCPSAPGHLLPLSSFIEFIFYYLGIGSFFCSDAGLTTIVARLNKLPFCSYRVSVAESFFPTTANLISALGYLGSS